MDSATLSTPKALDDNPSADDQARELLERAREERLERTEQAPNYGRLFVRLPRYQIRGLEHLIMIGIHPSKAAAIRYAIDFYLSTFEGEEEKDLIHGFLHLKKLAAKRDQLDTVRTWLIDAEGLLEEALKYGDKTLANEIFEAGKRSLLRLPKVWRRYCAGFLEESVAWSAASLLLKKEPFWTDDQELEE